MDAARSNSSSAPGPSEQHFVFPVPLNRGMKQLDRSKFSSVTRIPAVLIKQPSLVQQYMKELGPNLLSAMRFPNVVALESTFGQPVLPADVSKSSDSKSYRLLLVKPTEDAKANASVFVAERPGTQLVEFDVSVDYDYWQAEQVLAAILPREVTVPTSFEQVGHIAHFNLREEHEEYKEIIGQVVLDKHKTLRTVVNKSNTIDDTFRTFKMEVLAGDNDMMAELRESSCTFRFDFAKVYWNSRLQGEHERIVRLFQPGQYVCDVFGGVGPFAIPAAKLKGCVVYANDLNPSSYHHLVENIAVNRVEGLVLPFNLDGRDFIRESFKLLNDPENRAKVEQRRNTDRTSSEAALKKLESVGAGAAKASGKSRPGPAETRLLELQTAVEASSRPHKRMYDHYVMNLPATAVEFLDAFRGLLNGQGTREEWSQDEMPCIHVHCFSKAADPEADALVQVTRHLGHAINKDSPLLVGVHRVRDVAPNKEMMCVSFRLPLEAAFDTQS